MKKTALSAILLAMLCAAGAATAQGQAGQEYQYPSKEGSLSPPSTLRMTVMPGPAAEAPPPIHDTPESLQMYTECRDDSDRAAVSNAKMQAGIARCLDELAQRRQSQNR